MAIKWLIGTATQGSNDAFVQAEIQTGLSGLARVAWRIRLIEWYLPAAPGVDNQVEVLLRRNSAAAIDWVTQAHIAGIRRVVDFTTSGAFTYASYPNVQEYPKDLDFLIVEETIYLNLDTNGTSASNTAHVRIGVEQRNVTENERLSIQASY